MKYFKKSEFLCSCCQEEKMQPIFLQLIDETRHLARIPFIVNSGYRCEKKQQELRDQGLQTTRKGDKSPHEKGLAVDIKVKDSFDRYQIIRAWLTIGGNRYGIAKTFVHLDLDYSRKLFKTWYYNS